MGIAFEKRADQPRRQSPKSLKSGAVAKSVPAIRDWSIAAQQVLDELDAAPHGKKSSLMARIANASGRSAQYLNRAVAAHRFATVFPFDRVDLRTFTLPAVESLRRWSHYDRDAAKAAALSVVEYKLNCAQLIRAETTAQASADIVPSGSSLARRFWRFAFADISKNYSDFTTGHPQEGFLSPSFELIGSIRIAVLVVGPFSDTSSINRRIEDGLKRALGLCFIYDRVLIACGSAKIADYIWELMDNHKIRTSDIEVITYSKFDYAKICAT